MADVDAKLAASLKQAKTTLMYFVFVAKGNEGKLLVDKKRISPKDAAEAKKECGGGTIFKGRCKSEEGTLVFEVGKVFPPTVAALTKRIIKQTAGLIFDVEYRLAADLEADESEGESASEVASPGTESAATSEIAAPEAEQDTEADWLKARAEIEPTYAHALRDHPDKASALSAVMNFAQGKAAKGDFHGAVAALTKLAEELGKTPTPTGGGESQPQDLRAALADWQKVRQGVVDDLRKLCGAVAKTPHPKLKEAIVMINAVIKNLTPEPATLQQVKELERYLKQDDVVADVSNLALDIREPLLASLNTLKPQLQA